MTFFLTRITIHKMNGDEQAPAPQIQEQPQEEKKVVTPLVSKDSPGGKKGLAIAVIILFLILIGGGSFFFARNRSQAQPTPTPTPTESPTPTPEEESDETPTPTPTKKPTNTPSPKPTPTATPTSTPTSTTTTLSPTASLDGFQSNNGGGNAGLDIRAGNGSFVGAPSYELVTRGFVSFDISSIPSGATIEKATLRLYQKSVSGTPYSGGNKLIADHLDYGGTFENSDYNVSTISSNIGTLTENTTVEWKDLDVTDAFKADRTAGRTRSQFRFRLSTETDGDGSEDFAYLDSSESASNTPQLVVKYH